MKRLMIFLLCLMLIVPAFGQASYSVSTGAKVLYNYLKDYVDGNPLGTSAMSVNTGQRVYQNDMIDFIVWADSVAAGTAALTIHSLVVSDSAYIDTLKVDGLAILDKVDVASGEIDGTPIGANSASTGAFTTISVTDKQTFSEIAAPGTNPAANKGWVYVKDNAGASDLYYEDDAGSVFELTATGAEATADYRDFGNKTTLQTGNADNTTRASMFNDGSNVFPVWNIDKAGVETPLWGASKQDVLNGNVGTSLYGNGTNQYEYVGDAANLRMGTNGFSMDVTVSLPDYTPAAAVTIARKANTTNNLGWIWTIGTNGMMALAIGNGANFTTLLYTATTAISLANDEWGILAFVYNKETASVAGSVNFFQNGRLLTSVAVTAATPQTVTETNPSSLVFFQNIDGATEYAFAMSKRRFYNLGLSATTDLAIINGGAIPYKYQGASQTNIHTSSNAASIASEANATTGWTATNVILSSQAEPRTGSAGSYSIKSLRSGATADGYTMYAFTVLPKVYSVSFWARGSEVISNMLIRFIDNSYSTYSNGWNFNLTTDWAYYTTTLTVTNNLATKLAILRSLSDTQWWELDDISITQIGNIESWEPEGIGHNQWTGVNNLHGTISGALPVNLPVNAVETWEKTNLASSTTFTLPQGYYCDKIGYYNRSADNSSIAVSTAAGNEAVADTVVIGTGAIGFLTLKTQKVTFADDIFYVEVTDSIDVQAILKRYDH